MTIHAIEMESYRILDGRVDLAHLAAGPRAVVARVIHASADLEYATTMVLDEAAVAAGVRALRQGATVITDVEMVRAGITRAVRALCFLDGALSGPAGYPTRSAVAVRRAAERYADGAVWVIGCAPTALMEVINLATTGAVRPALVIGLPVGFVGAAEAKAATRAASLSSITNVGEKGGSSVAAATVNALARLAGLGAGDSTP